MNDFLESARRAHFAWGQSDCILFVADFVAWQTGRDPAEGLRGTYRNRREAQTIIEAHQGLVGLVQARIGWARTDAPQIGDVAVLQSAERPAPFGALRGDGIWYGQGAKGLAMIAKANVLASWRNPCPR